MTWSSSLPGNILRNRIPELLSLRGSYLKTGIEVVDASPKVKIPMRLSSSRDSLVEEGMIDTKYARLFAIIMFGPHQQCRPGTALADGGSLIPPFHQPRPQKLEQHDKLDFRDGAGQIGGCVKIGEP